MGKRDGDSGSCDILVWRGKSSDYTKPAAWPSQTKIRVGIIAPLAPKYRQTRLFANSSNATMQVKYDSLQTQNQFNVT